MKNFELVQIEMKIVDEQFVGKTFLERLKMVETALEDYGTIQDKLSIVYVLRTPEEDKQYVSNKDFNKMLERSRVSAEHLELLEKIKSR